MRFQLGTRRSRRRDARQGEASWKRVSDLDDRDIRSMNENYSPGERFLYHLSFRSSIFRASTLVRFSLRRAKTRILSILGYQEERAKFRDAQSSGYLVRASPFSSRGIVMHRLPHSLRSSRGRAWRPRYFE